jgi:redox-sensing transcriptional repressor
VALLAVPAAEAQALTDRLAAAGIRAILSYAPISLTTPPGVYVSYSDPVVQLQQMTYYLETETE